MKSLIRQFLSRVARVSSEPVTGMQIVYMVRREEPQARKATFPNGDSFRNLKQGYGAGSLLALGDTGEYLAFEQLPDGRLPAFCPAVGTRPLCVA